MTKITELNDKDLDLMINKYEKTLRLLLKEKEKRTGKSSSIKIRIQPKFVMTPSGKEDALIVFEDDVIESNEQLRKKDLSRDDGTENMRLTKVLKLSKNDLERFNKAVETVSKKKKKDEPS